MANNCIVKDNTVIPPLLYNIENQAPERSYLNAKTNATITVSTLENNVVFDPALFLGNNFVASGAGYQYLGSMPQKFSAYFDCYSVKIATNTQVQIRLNKLTSPPTPLIQSVGQVYVDKTEGHLLIGDVIFTISPGDIIYVSLICSTGTVSVQSLPALGGVQTTSVSLTLQEI